MRALLFALVVVSAVGCKKKEGTDTAAAPAETKPAPPAAAGTPADPKPAEPAAPVPPPPASGTPVDVCGQIPKEKIEGAVGGKATGEPQKTEAMGSMLGQCTWMTDKGMAMVSARPATEYDGSVKMAKDGKDVAGVGEKASWSTLGLMVKPAGKPYMLQVMAGPAGKFDEAQSTAVAKVAVENMK